MNVFVCCGVRKSAIDVSVVVLLACSHAGCCVCVCAVNEAQGCGYVLCV